MADDSNKVVGGEAAAGAAGAPESQHSHSAQDGFAKMVFGAIGIVFGDIGTSPLYALRETFDGHHKLALDQVHIFGVISLMFWSMILVVTIKYVTIIMRADNKGEGGSLALLALINGHTKSKRWSSGLILLGVFATALFYGDSMITPAVSVLSAVEGLAIYNPNLAPFILPAAVLLLFGLFSIQRGGTSKVAALFGPIMLIYFSTIATLGVISIISTPTILLALNPYWAVHFFAIDPLAAFLALGSVVLAVTGAEALYADMGHFGRNPIRVSWMVFVLPALMLNYMGQGALLMRVGESALTSPFYNLAPTWGQLPLVILATMAAIIASQAVITGAFSVTHQAIQLGFMPRLRIAHTNASTAGQIYIPLINWGLMVMVIILVLSFRTSSNLSAAYGIAVTGAMFIDNMLLTVVLLRLWKWNRLGAYAILSVFYIIDGAYLAANLTKVPDGGWVPLFIGLVVFTLLTTWSRGRHLMMERMRESAMPIPVFVASAANSAVRVPGTAVFMTSTADGVPHALLHNLKHNKVLHERVVLLTVKVKNVPVVADEERYQLEDLGRGFFRLQLNYGFMQEPDVPAALKRVHDCGQSFKMMDTSFFLARQTLLPSSRPGMAVWREKIFAWMLRNAESAMEFFRLPTNRVVELGSQVEI
ncbi:MAG: potassium transporter Kup [Sphingobium sp.]|nr:potassium transporter Kup [Sphingobium sp.]